MSKKHKLNFCLDLDQTLLSAEVLAPDDDDDEGEEEIYDIEKNKLKAAMLNFFNMDNYYVIFERPGLQKFLDYLFENFNVSVFTAASKDYALFIIENMILSPDHPERKLDHVFWSYHCKISSKNGKGSKDLSLLWDFYKIDGFGPNNTFILDDYDEVIETNTSELEPRGIEAKPFYFTDENSENDDFLHKLAKKLKDKKQKLLDGNLTAIHAINHELKL